MNLRKGITQIFIAISVSVLILISCHPAICALPADTMGGINKAYEEMNRGGNSYSHQSQGSPVTVNINIGELVLFSLGGIGLLSLAFGLFRR
jgi:hypothetical protein